MPIGSTCSSMRESCGKATPVVSPRRPAPGISSLRAHNHKAKKRRIPGDDHSIFRVRAASSRLRRLLPSVSLLRLTRSPAIRSRSASSPRCSRSQAPAPPGAAQIAADEINAKGGVLGRKIEIVSYDNKSSSADSVRALQRAVSEDKVSAGIASHLSEAVLALEPWAARLKMPLITPGAASNEITKAIHNDYDKNKYTFHGYLTSAAQRHLVCDAAKALLVDQLKFTTVA